MQRFCLINGTYVWTDRRVRRTGRAKAVKEAEAIVRETTKERVKVS